MALDTLKVARRLQEAGFSEAQAAAVVAAVQDGTEGAAYATKPDLALLGTELRAEISVVRSEMREMEQRLITRIEGVESRLEAAITEAKSELLGRMFQMVLSAVLLNIIAIVGALFAFAKMLGH